MSRRGEIRSRVEIRGRNRMPRGRGVRAVVRRQPADQPGDAGCDRSDQQADGLQEMRGQDGAGLMAAPAHCWSCWRRCLSAAGRCSRSGSPDASRRVGNCAADRSPGRRRRCRVRSPMTCGGRATIRNSRRSFRMRSMATRSRCNTNQCLTCHARQFIEGSGAPMISVTHFMDRDGQVLADVTPRRYFCTACHVPQTDAQPLVANTFRDALAAEAVSMRCAAGCGLAWPCSGRSCARPPPASASVF